MTNSSNLLGWRNRKGKGSIVSYGFHGGGSSSSGIQHTFPSDWDRPLKKPNLTNTLLKRYGSTFGKRPIGDNTYVKNEYYGDSSFLTNAIIFRLGMPKGQPWSYDDDRKWRATTRAPYFENNVPGLLKK